MLDEPHQPARYNCSAHEHGKTEEAEPDHHAWLGALRDPEDHRGKERKQEDGTKVSDGHAAFLPTAME